MYEHLTDEQLERLIVQKRQEWRDKRNQAQKNNPPIPSHIRVGYRRRTPEIRRLEEEQQRRIRQKEKNQQLKTLLIIVGVISLILYFVLG